MAVSPTIGSEVPAVKEVRAVRNACTVLAAVAEAQPIGVSELARTTGIDKSAIQRIVITLHAAGWLLTHPEPPTRWEVSPANPLLRHSSESALERLARPSMNQLRDDSGETVILVSRRAGRLMIVAAAESRHPVRLSPTLGFVLPFEGSSAAAAIAACLPPGELRRLQVSHPLLSDRKLAQVRRRGWASNDREVVDGVRAVAAAMVAPDGYPLGAIAVCGPTSRVGVDDLPRLGNLVVVAAGRIAVDGH